jgi:hypothetical protein
VNVTKTPHDYAKGRHGVVGILSSSFEKNQHLRMAQRSAWVKDAAKYDVHVYFLIDQESPEIEKEQKLYGDIIFLNASYSGRAVRFGEKLYNWYAIAEKLHPEASFVAKVDDDCVVCSNVMWPHVWKNVQSRSYMGWQH